MSFILPYHKPIQLIPPAIHPIEQSTSFSMSYKTTLTHSLLTIQSNLYQYHSFFPVQNHHTLHSSHSPSPHWRSNHLQSTTFHSYAYLTGSPGHFGSAPGPPRPSSRPAGTRPPTEPLRQKPPSPSHKSTSAKSSVTKTTSHFLCSTHSATLLNLLLFCSLN